MLFPLKINIIFIVNFIFKHKSFLLLSSFYFLLRVVNLTKLPIFNDEAIYLDWGFRETHVPGYLYYSLYDAKQPFLMWIFGIFQTFFSDPLFAGRLVSVIFGFLTLVGIYKISKKFFDNKIAIIASIFYIIVPIFVFYDRQALMEGAVGTIEVWSVYFLLKVIDEKKYKNSISLGVILGIGFFIKSSALIFLILSTCILVFYILKNKQKGLFFKNLVVVFSSFLATNFLLFINPQFWQTLSSNNRFVFTFSELIQFPIKAWAGNLAGNLEIGFFYLTPLIFILSCIGIYFVIVKMHSDQKILIVWILLSIFIQTMLIKGTSHRYLVSFLPLFVIFASYSLMVIYRKIKINKYLLLAIPVLAPLLLSIFLILNPIQYIQFTSKFSKYTLLEYISGQTSGIGVLETVDFIKKETKGNNALIGVALNTGNPESAILDYFYKNKNIKVTYLDLQLFGESLKNVQCLKHKDPVYFVSRDQQQGGLNKYLHKVTSFRNPYSNYSIGIYKIDNNCTGSSIDISELRYPSS